MRIDVAQQPLQRYDSRMDIPDSEWSFDGIRAVNAERADRLDRAEDPERLMLALASAVGDAVDSGDIRLAVDSLRNEFTERRSIFQFRVSPDLYDWFYSARTGYRAQFWKSAAGGTVFNGKIVAAITEILRRRLPESLSVRVIKLLDPGTHEEIDAGELQVTRAQFLHSFQPDASKIWICERRYSNSRVQPDDIGTIELREAAKTGRLIVPRWDRENPETGQMAEGLLAPYPTPDNSWLDMKGGFVSADGSGSQVKPPGCAGRSDQKLRLDMAAIQS